MDKTHFWRLIEDAKANSNGQCEEQAELLEKALAKFPPEEIIAFDRLSNELHDQLCRWDLWGAAYLINGGASDDGFAYFRCWLIGQGQAVFENAIQTPDGLADVIAPDFADAECEDLWHVADYAYEKMTGSEMPLREAPQSGRSSEPVGMKWEEDDLDTMFPKIAAKINSQE